MILDTSFIIDLLKNNNSAILKLQEFEDENKILATTSINVFELYRGFDIIPTEKTLKAYKLLDHLKILSLDNESGKIAGKIARKLDKLGKMLESEDIMIAAITINNNEKIITRNTKHFERIDNLAVETY